MRKAFVMVAAATLMATTGTAQADRQAEHFGNCGDSAFNGTSNSNNLNVVFLNCPDHPPQGRAEGGRQGFHAGSCRPGEGFITGNSRVDSLFLHDCPNS